MSIKFSCECGKSLSVRDEHAGKKVRCPACGQPTRVPDQESISLAAEPTPEPMPGPDFGAAPAAPASSVVLPPVAKTSPLVPVAVFLCIVALLVSVGGLLVYLKTAKEIDTINRKVSKLENDHKLLKASVTAVLRRKAAPPAQAKAPQQPSIDMKNVESLLKAAVGGQIEHQKAINELLDGLEGKK